MTKKGASSGSKTGKAVPISNQSAGFGIGELFGDTLKLYAANPLPFSLAAMVTFGVYGIFRYPAQQLFVDGKVFQSVGVDLVGLLIAGVIALPWYHFSLAAVDGNPISFAEPFQNWRRYGYQAVASFWFWAGILLGLRYLFGLPSVLVLLLYCFHGFVIVDGSVKGGMMALGQSVRLSEGRRMLLFGVGCLLLVFNLFGAFGIGFRDSFGLPAAIGIAIIGLTITTSVTMLAGARLYRLCAADVPPQEPTKKYVRKRGGGSRAATRRAKAKRKDSK